MPEGSQPSTPIPDESSGTGGACGWLTADQFGSILGSLTDALMIVDRNWHIAYVNPGYVKLVSRLYPSAQDLLGKDLWEKFPDIVGSDVGRSYRQAMAEQRGKSFKLFYEPVKAWLEVRTFPSPDMLSILIRDVTERKEAEREYEALWQREREAREEAQALNEVARTLTAGLDLQETVQKATDAATRLTRAQFGAFFYNLVNERQESYVLYTLSGAAREAFEKFGLPRNTAIFAPTFKGEGVVRLADVHADPRFGKNAPHHGMPKGHLPVRSYLAVPVISRNGGVIGGMFFGHPEPGVFTAQSERVAVGIAAQAAIAMDNAKLYESVQRTAERLSLALTASDLGDWNWDAATDRMEMSERAAEIFGIPRKPATRTQLRELLCEEDRERSLLALQEAMRSHTDYDIEYRVNRPDGTQCWVAAKGRAIYDSQGKATTMLGVVADITKRREAQAELEKLVRERTVELTESNDQMETLVYSIAHDLRAPLRSMQAFSRMLLEEYAPGLGDSARQYAQRIVRAAETMDALVLDLLNYGRVARADMVLEPVSVETAWQTAISQHEKQIQEQQAVIETVLPLPHVQGHEVTLGQVLANLLGNALKFVAPNTRPLIRCRAEEKPGVVRLWIEDNGIGIAPEHQEKVFRVFERLHGRQFPGTGVGLSIVRKGVERMGGQVGLESAPGRGSRFWIELPKARKPD